MLSLLMLYCLVFNYETWRQVLLVCSFIFFLLFSFWNGKLMNPLSMMCYWQRAWNKPVMDRVGLIIEIFNAHAFTKEAKLQVSSMVSIHCAIWLMFDGIVSWIEFHVAIVTVSKLCHLCRLNWQLYRTRRRDLFVFVAQVVAIHLVLLEKLKLLVPEGWFFGPPVFWSLTPFLNWKGRRA